MPTPLVSVLLPCYNAMPYLPHALESIINQTYTNLEIICINDGSTDTTGAVLDTYAKKDNRIKVIHNSSNLKLIKSLNKGIDLATGEFLARMDADDISWPDRIEKELQYLLENKTIDVIGCGISVIDEDGKVMSNPIIRQHTPRANYFASFFYVPLGHSELLFRTSVLKQNQYLEKVYALHTEDYELWSRLLRSGVKMMNIDERLHKFRKNTNSVSWTFTEIQNANFIECARMHLYKCFEMIVDVQMMMVIVNRIPREINQSTLKQGIIKIGQIKKLFIIKEGNQLNRSDKNEILLIYKTHILDICIQVIKKARLDSKLYSLLIIMIHFDMFFNGKVWKYIFTKIKRTD